MPRQPRTYSLPEVFMQDQGVPVRWRIWGILNGFFINNQKCWASNEWFAEKLGVHKDTVSEGIALLEKVGVIRCERTRRSRLISNVLHDTSKEESHAEIGESTDLRSVDVPISDRRKRLSISVSNSVKEKNASKLATSFEVVQDEPRKKAPPRDRKAFALKEQLLDLFEKETGHRPSPHQGDYARVQAARKLMSDEEVVQLVEDSLASRRSPRTIREALTARAIDIYRQDNA